MKLVLFRICIPLAFLFYIPIGFLDHHFLYCNTAPHLERMQNNLHFHHDTKNLFRPETPRVTPVTGPQIPVLTCSCGIGDDLRPFVILPWYKVRTSTSFNFTFLNIWAETSPDSSPESKIAFWYFILIFRLFEFHFFYFWFDTAGFHFFIQKETCPRFLNVESSNDEKWLIPDEMNDSLFDDIQFTELFGYFHFDTW